MTDELLLLQQMERALVRAHLGEPDVLSDVELRRLRYLISFARLAVFEPGAAGPWRGRGRPEVDLTE
ncbi:hypothetical protein, partial [Nocardioides stalactiti]|uniref:hypothetical protein n=1 Tax=Nocardioides stalactiti TaxID=2755356 RepID=UPI001C7EEF53